MSHERKTSVRLLEFFSFFSLCIETSKISRQSKRKAEQDKIEVR